MAQQKITFNQYKIMRTQLLMVCKFSSFLCLLLGFSSCDPENEKEYSHKLQVENTSISKIILLGYNNYDDNFNKVLPYPILQKMIVIEVNSLGPIVMNKNIFFDINNSSYFFGIHVDSLVLKFENEKGFYSTIKRNINDEYQINNEYWIPSKSTLFAVSSKDVRKEGDVYIYSITQEDYENAHVLVE